jgi:hypothetical protein
VTPRAILEALRLVDEHVSLGYGVALCGRAVRRGGRPLLAAAVEPPARRCERCWAVLGRELGRTEVLV